MEKYCGACKTVKDVSEFGKHSKRKDGLQVYCRICLKEKSESARKKRVLQPVEDFRICYKCGESKPINSFVKDSSGRGGYSTICKVCKQESIEVWKKENPEKVRQIRKAWLDKGDNRERYNQYMSQFKKRKRIEEKPVKKACCKKCHREFLRSLLNHVKICNECRLKGGN